MSKKQFKTVEDMSAFLTHEMNTPLTYMKAHIEMMDIDIKKLEESKIKDDLLLAREKMLKGILRIQKVVNEVHSVTKDLK